MIITDPKVIKWQRQLCDIQFDEDIAEYPEDERDGRSDIQFFADEVSYFISLYEDEDHDWNYSLKEARRILRETKNGRVIPLDQRTLQPEYGYWPSDIDNCKRLVNGYKRLKYRYKKLNEFGFYGMWY